MLRADTEQPSKSPVPGRAEMLIFFERAWPHLNGWQNSCCDGSLAQLAGNPPSRVAKGAFPGEVSHWRRSTAKPPEAEAARESCWPVGTQRSCLNCRGGPWGSCLCCGS